MLPEILFEKRYSTPKYCMHRTTDIIENNVAFFLFQACLGFQTAISSKPVQCDGVYVSGSA